MFWAPIRAFWQYFPVHQGSGSGRRVQDLDGASLRWTEGRNILIDYRFALTDAARILAAAAIGTARGDDADVRGTLTATLASVVFTRFAMMGGLRRPVCAAAFVMPNFGGGSN